MDRMRRKSGLTIIGGITVACFAGPVLAQDDLTVWPNRVSSANSDDWLVKNHDRIRQMRPRLLVLNFANGVSAEKARAKVDGLIGALRESSR